MGQRSQKHTTRTNEQRVLKEKLAGIATRASKVKLMPIDKAANALPNVDLFEQ